MSDFYCAEVLSGKTPVNRVAETAAALAFRHTRPHWPEHIVVIPKSHVPSLLDCDDALMLELWDLVKTVAMSVLDAQGACRVVTNLGAYQESKHLHWHVGAGDPIR